MTEMPTDARAAARKRIEERRGFVPHLIIYLVINAGLILLWMSMDIRFFWPGFVLIFWGVGVLMHAWNAFISKPISEADIKRELERMR